MARRKGGNSFNVRVEGLEGLSRMPGFIDSGQRMLLDRGSKGIAAEIAKKAPGGPGGKAGRDVEALTTSSTTALIRSRGFKGARLLDKGGTIRPKRGKALKLHDGRFVRGKVFVKGRGYWRKGLRSRSKIIRAAYHDAFGNLERHGGL